MEVKLLEDRVLFTHLHQSALGFPGDLAHKNLPAMQTTQADTSSIHGKGCPPLEEGMANQSSIFA